MKITNEVIGGTEDYTDHLESINDRVRSKVINGRTYIIQASDPYGHWAVIKTGAGGKLPKELDQSFTTTYNAWASIEAYENIHKIRLDDLQTKKLSKIKTIEI